MAGEQFQEGEGIPRGVSGTAREAPGALVSASALPSTDGSRISDRIPHSEGAGSDREPAPFGLISIDPRLSPAVVVMTTAPRICLGPDFAEELGLELIRRAAIARQAGA